MNADVISVPPEMDQEDVARLFEHYDMLALPVVDADAQDPGHRHRRRRRHRPQAGAGRGHPEAGRRRAHRGAYFKTDVLDASCKKRAGWLIAIFLGEILTASVLEHYETARRTFAAIEVFVPLIISSGGNTGSQASSLVIRGMALERVRRRRRRQDPAGASCAWAWCWAGILGLIGLLRALPSSATAAAAAWRPPWGCR